MGTRHVMIGTGLALTGLAGVGIAAVGSGASDGVTPLQPAADPFTTTNTQTVEDRSAARPASRVRVTRHDDGRTEIRHATHTTTTARGGADDGPNHDLNDDHGGRGEVEAGDDRGGRGEIEAGDDRGGRGEVEAGDDRRGRGEDEAGDDRGGNSGPGSSNSGHGGGNSGHGGGDD